jgi:hypothetical protein
MGISPVFPVNKLNGFIGLEKTQNKRRKTNELFATVRNEEVIRRFLSTGPEDCRENGCGPRIAGWQ